MIVRAASIHVLGDILQSIGVFCAAITIYLKPDWVRADPICTFMFAIIVLCTTIPILKDGVLVSGSMTDCYSTLVDICLVLPNAQTPFYTNRALGTHGGIALIFGSRGSHGSIGPSRRCRLCR